jgi:hypothetical protein
MTRTVWGMCIAAAFAFAVSVGAQSTTTDQRSRLSESASGHAVTVTGCLTKSADGNYMLTNARMDNAMGDHSAATTTTGAATTTAGTTATGTTVGTTGTTSAPSNTAESISGSKAMSWVLHGGNDLDKHVGHKIQVSGRTSYNPSSSSPSATGTSGTSTTTTGAATTTEETKSSAAGEPRLDVQSVKMVASSCQ